MRNLMMASLLDDLRAYHAVLDAAVVMPHHFHLVARPPEGKTASWLAERLKSNSARRVLPHLPPAIKRDLAEQHGLNRRAMWFRSFRGIVASSGPVFRQKVRYTHLNPVFAGYVEKAADYRWSTSWMGGEGMWTPESGVAITPELVASYCPDYSLLDLRDVRRRELDRNESAD